MSIEYKMRFNVPTDYDSSALFKKLPSPISRPKMVEIYNFKIEHDGFYFIDHFVNDQVASIAFKLFVDEALSYGGSVEIVKP
jgi:hypothetical protein